MKYSILVVEDNSPLRLGICNVLKREGFQVISAHSMATAMHSYQEHEPDFVILDIMLPDGEGYNLIERMKAHHDTYILMLTALSDPESKKLAYAYGADDYACKPFDLFELIYKLRAAAKRIHSHRDTFHIGDVSLTLSTGELKSSDQSIHIPPSQTSLLKALQDTHLEERVFTLKLAQELLPYPVNSTKQLHTLVTRLRNSLAEIGCQQLIIDSVYGKGYTLVVLNDGTAP